jgi:hypothetical protein
MSLSSLIQRRLAVLVPQVCVGSMPQQHLGDGGAAEARRVVERGAALTAVHVRSWGVVVFIYEIITTG